MLFLSLVEETTYNVESGTGINGKTISIEEVRNGLILAPVSVIERHTVSVLCFCT